MARRDQPRLSFRRCRRSETPPTGERVGRRRSRDPDRRAFIMVPSFGAVRLVLSQTGRDGVCATVLVAKLVLIAPFLHAWRPGGPEQPYWDIPRVLPWSRGILVLMWQLEVILGRASFQRLHRGPFHIPIERLTSVLPWFAFPVAGTTRGQAGRALLIIVSRRFRRC
jgi:hypothetical protein